MVFTTSSAAMKALSLFLSYDVNVAHGQELLKKETGEAGALAHGVKFWSLIARYKYGAAPDDHGLFGSPAQNVILAGRMWEFSFERMAAGIKALGGSDCSIVVLNSRNAYRRGASEHVGLFVNSGMSTIFS